MGGPGSGVVGSLFKQKAFGFILNHKPELDDVFFHFNDYPPQTLIQTGDEVSFECVQNTANGKFKAQRIRILKKAGGAHGGQWNNGPANSHPIKRERSQSRSPRKAHKRAKTSHKKSSPDSASSRSNSKSSDGDIPTLGFFKLVKKDVTDIPMYVPVFPIGGAWRSKKQ